MKITSNPSASLDYVVRVQGYHGLHSKALSQKTTEV